MNNTVIQVTISCRAFIISNNKVVQHFTTKDEDIMRAIANCVIDRILQDKQNNSLKFLPERDTLIMEHHKDGNQE